MYTRRLTTVLMGVLMGLWLLSPAKGEAAIVSLPAPALVLRQDTGQKAATVIVLQVDGFYLAGGTIWATGKCTLADGSQMPFNQPLAVLRGTSLNLHMEFAPLDITHSVVRVQTARVVIDLKALPGTPLAQHLRLIAYHLFNRAPANVQALILLLNQLART